MKRIAYSFLLITLLSCGSRWPDSNSRITLIFRDSAIEREDVFLLSVRDRAIVVSPYIEDLPIASLIRHGRTIPFEKIEAIKYHQSASFWDVALPGIGGCTLGGAGGFLLAASRPDNNVATTFVNLFAYSAIGEVIGLAIGLILGSTLNTHDNTFLLNARYPIADIRKHAIFRSAEPPELQSIE